MATVDQARIQGIGSDAATGEPQQPKAMQWDRMSTAEILTALGTATQELSEMLTQLASRMGTNFEHVKAALDCQRGPDQATLSAEQIVVEHAFEQVKSSLTCCQAPDKSQLDSKEIIVSSAGDTQAPEETMSRNAGTSVHEDCGVQEARSAPLQLDLLDLSEPTPAPTKECPTDISQIHDEPQPDRCEKQQNVRAADSAESLLTAPQADLLDFAEASPTEENLNQLQQEPLPDHLEENKEARKEDFRQTADPEAPLAPLQPDLMDLSQPKPTKLESESAVVSQADTESEIKNLKAQQAKAVEDENFEEAAAIKKQIARLLEQLDSQDALSQPQLASSDVVVSAGAPEKQAVDLLDFS